MINGKLFQFAIAGALGLLATGALAGQITLYEHPGFAGTSVMSTGAVTSLPQTAFGNAASSGVVSDGAWEVCTDAGYRGRCAQLAPGYYSRLSVDLDGTIASLRPIGYQTSTARVVVAPDPPSLARPLVINSGSAPIVISQATPPVVVSPDSQPVVVAPDSRPIVVDAPVAAAVPLPAGPRIILYKHDRGNLRAVEVTATEGNLATRGFDDSADAAFVSSGVWRVCNREHGRGDCVDLSPGRYDSLGSLDGRVRSVYLVRADAPVTTVTTVEPVSPGRIVLYQFANFGGPSVAVDRDRFPDVDWTNFRYPAASLRVESGSWLVCPQIGYQGECRVFDPGDYPVLTGSLVGGVASAHQVWHPAYSSLDQYRYLSTK